MIIISISDKVEYLHSSLPHMLEPQCEEEVNVNGTLVKRLKWTLNDDIVPDNRNIIFVSSITTFYITDNRL